MSKDRHKLAISDSTLKSVNGYNFYGCILMIETIRYVDRQAVGRDKNQRWFQKGEGVKGIDGVTTYRE